MKKKQIDNEIIKYFLLTSTKQDILGTTYKIMDSETNDKVKISGLLNIIENFYTKVKRFNEEETVQIETSIDKEEIKNERSNNTNTK